MIKIVFPGDDLERLAIKFRATPLESFAIILARPVKVGRHDWRLLVQTIDEPEEAEYEVRSAEHVRAAAAFRLAHEKRARRLGFSIIYCHSHPDQTGVPKFSRTVDDASERSLAKYANERVPGVPHCSVLIGKDAIAARELGDKKPIELWQVGAQITRYAPAAGARVAAQHDRQVLAFGKEGQRAIQGLRIAIVGCGGTGSVVAQELAYLGAANFLLIDPDRIEKTNLNRVVGATAADLGRMKVRVTKRMIRRIAPRATVDICEGNVLDGDVARELLGVDVVCCCTDSHGSRFCLNQLAYQYFIPCIDMGVRISVNVGSVVAITGRTQMLAPGLSCLVCVDGILDNRRVMWDLQNRKQRKADPYFTEQTRIKQPAVISLNGAVASQAVTLFLAAVARIPVGARSIAFRGMRGDSRMLDTTPRSGCVNCSDAAYFGKGDEFPLPERSR